MAKNFTNNLGLEALTPHNCPSALTEHSLGLLDHRLSSLEGHPVHHDPPTTHSPHVNGSRHTVQNLWLTEFSYLVCLYNGDMNKFSLRKYNNNKKSLQVVELEERKFSRGHETNSRAKKKKWKYILYIFLLYYSSDFENCSNTVYPFGVK